MNPSQQVQQHPRYRVRAEVDVVDESAALQRLPLENISLGGMFIRTRTASPPGDLLRLRLYDPASDASLGLSARVIHVIDEPMAPLKRHPAGMGVQYQNVSPHSAAMLRALVDKLVHDEQAAELRPSSARFVDATTVQVGVDRALLRSLWRQSLRLGGLFAEGAAPPLGTTVTVLLGPLRLQAEVVHVQPGVGAGLQLADPDGSVRAMLSRYLDGGAPELPAAPAAVGGAPLAEVLGAARRLFAGIEAGDGFAAIGLSMTAADGDVKSRIGTLRRLFAGPRPDASPPQAARIEGAQRALARLEPALLARVAALRHEAELVPRDQQPATEKSQLTELLDAAAVAERGGDPWEARRRLASALELAPSDEDAKRRLAALQQAQDAAKAKDALTQAEVFVRGLGMRDDAARLAHDALALSQARDVRLRALGVLAKAGLVDEAIAVGEAMLTSDPHDALALQALMHLYEKNREWARAARVAQALSRLRPGDVELQQAVRRLIRAARG